MSLEDLGNIGEFVGAIAVVLSLIYLAVQIRQNTRQVDVNTTALQNAAFDQATQSFSRFRDPMIRDSALAGVYLTGLQDADALEASDLFRFRQILMDLFLGFYSMYLRSGDSAFFREAWEANVPIVRDLLSYPGVEAWWDATREKCGYHPSFVAKVDELLAALRATDE